MFVRNVRLALKYKRFIRYRSSLENKVVDKIFIDKNGLEKTNPNLKDFVQKTLHNSSTSTETLMLDKIPYLDESTFKVDGLKVYFEVYGCQMNVNDTEVVWAILQNAGYIKTNDVLEADVILIITCAIREGAEKKIWTKLKNFRSLKRMQNILSSPLKIGILGCMAERLKEKVLEKEKLVDLVAGPDSYKDLPRLLTLTRGNYKAVNVLLSIDETYADVMPVRLNEDSVTSYISIMRGCDNMCTYCIVPFTRGRERSRAMDSILDEVRYISDKGIKQITLLGQNVNSYRDTSTKLYYMGVDKNNNQEETKLAKGFKTVYKAKKGGIRFAELLDRVSSINPEIRVRFTSPHPKDFPDEVLEIIKERNNICKCLHLPAQSGNSAVLQRMRRGYTREAYLELVERVREVLPGVTLTSDFIAGFCGETEDEFQDTVSLLSIVKYHVAYLFAYSMREKTTAYRRYQDDVSIDVKNRRVKILSDLFRNIAEQLNRQDIGKTLPILIEGDSKKSSNDYYGKTDGNIKVIIPKMDVPASFGADLKQPMKPGDYICVQINDANSQILKGVPLYHTTLQDYCNGIIYNSSNQKCSHVVM